MPMTLSPFRYFQMAQYLLRRWLDHTSIAGVASSSSSSWKGKGKGRATPLWRGSGGTAAMTYANSGSLRSSSSSSLEERRTWSDMVPSAPTSTRGSGSGSGSPPNLTKSNLTLPTPSPRKTFEYLRPDPRMPSSSPPPEIYRLMNDERLMEPGLVTPPKEVIVLCHGLYGFSTATPIPLFPSLKLHYWAAVLEVLRDTMGANVLVVGVKGTGSVKERAEQMHAFLKDNLPRGAGVNFVAHSMGGLDCRYLISHLKPTSYKPLSLTTIGTPHHGSPFMDWCAANIGVGSAATAAAAAALSAASPAAAKALPYSLKSPLLSRIPEEAGKKDGLGAFTSALTSYLLNIFDSPAYSNLTTNFLREQFNESTPDVPGVQYTSVAGRTTKMSVLHPLWFPKLVLDAAAENGYSADGSVTGKDYEGNDGLVSVSSSKWGHFLGAVDGAHHWDLRGEGGLFPTTFGDGDKKKREKQRIQGHDLEREPVDSNSGKSRDPRETPNTTSWDWQGDFGNGVSEHLGLAADAARGAVGSAMDTVKSAGETAAKAGVAAGNRVGLGSLGSGMGNSNERSTSSSSSSSSQHFSQWDLNQVGQVLDWVGDLLPGGGTETKERKMADARREKQKADMSERERERREVASASGEAEKERKEQIKKQKFDLGRFYGGLMLKLRDDGL